MTNYLKDCTQHSHMYKNLGLLIFYPGFITRFQSQGLILICWHWVEVLFCPSETVAPFLWIFALVYINDIVIFSLTLQDHISHLVQVFKAIETSQVALPITKCHFGYQSLLLLGQKVSQLGLSTHKEKVNAILLLDELKKCHDLQVFLGMMVWRCFFRWWLDICDLCCERGYWNL